MIPGISKWRIDQARQHAKEAGKGQPLPEIPSFRTKIDREKVDHFIEYISRMWRLEQKLSNWTRERRSSYQPSLGPLSLHASSDNI